jgi:site-specific DNA recombinase
MRKVIGYVRVSSESQAAEGVSLDAQRAKLQAYCFAMGLDLVGIEADEGVSAKTLRRPALQRALAALEEGRADGLVVVKLDRLTRSVRDLCDLVEQYFVNERISLLSLGESIDTKSAAGRLVMNVLACVAQWEREATAERTRDALAEVLRQGGTLGAAALGWTRTDDLDGAGRRAVVPVAAEADTVARIRSLRAEGRTLRGIAAQLQAEGRATKRGGAWAAEQVRAVLARSAPEPSAPATELMTRVLACVAQHELGATAEPPAPAAEPSAPSTGATAEPPAPAAPEPPAPLAEPPATSSATPSRSAAEPTAKPLAKPPAKRVAKPSKPPAKPLATFSTGPGVTRVATSSKPTKHTKHTRKEAA